MLATVLVAGATASTALADQELYVADGAASAVRIFPTSATGNAAPANSLTENGPPASEAFDQSGNLWVASGAGSGWDGNPGANTPGLIQAYPPGTLAGPNSQPTVTITVSPSFSSVTAGMAFDASGNMWVVDGGGQVDEFTASQLTSSGTKSPAVTIGGVNTPNGVAFDSAGNMWVSSYGDSTVRKYTPAQLQSSGSPTPAVVISGSGLASPARLKFDSGGNLWVANFGGNSVVKYNASQLTATGSPAPAVTISANGSSLDRPNGLDFDADGNLWVANVGSSVVEFAASQIGSSGLPAPANTIKGPSTGLQTPFMIIAGPAPSTAHATYTQVICNLEVSSGIDTCGATVGDASSTSPSPPTGTATFSVVAGSDTQGTFPAGPSCTVQSSNGSLGGNTSFCSVEFKPAATDIDFPHIHAAYSGDALRLPSAADTALLKACVGFSPDDKVNTVNGQHLLGSAAATAAVPSAGQGASYYNPVQPCSGNAQFPPGYLDPPTTNNSTVDPTGKQTPGCVGPVNSLDGIHYITPPSVFQANMSSSCSLSHATLTDPFATVAAKHKKKPRAATIRYRLKGPAMVTFWVAKVVKRKHHKQRLVLVKGHFNVLSKKGVNTFKFNGWFLGHKLKPGRYVLIARPFLEGSVGRPVTMRFRVK